MGFNTILVILFTLFFNATTVHADQYEVRAAIDFGSGAVKMQVSLVDIDEKRLIGTPLLTKQVSLNLTEDVAANHGSISDGLLIQSLSLLQSLKEEAAKASLDAGYPSVKFSGIATAAFRKASNGQELLQKFDQQLGIHFQILSQEEEGVLGFMTAKALYPEVEDQNLLAWDNGNGSLQMTSKRDNHYNVYKAPLGHGVLRTILSQEIRHEPVFVSSQTSNPVSIEESKELDPKLRALLPETPEWLQQQFADGHGVIATFGDGNSLFAVMAQSLAIAKGIESPVSQAILTREELQAAYDKFIGSPDEVFEKEGVYKYTLTGAIYLLAIMDYFGIEKFEFRKSVGNTSGILISEQFWD